MGTRGVLKHTNIHVIIALIILLFFIIFNRYLPDLQCVRLTR